MLTWVTWNLNQKSFSLSNSVHSVSLLLVKKHMQFCNSLKNRQARAEGGAEGA